MLNLCIHCGHLIFFLTKVFSSGLPCLSAFTELRIWTRKFFSLILFSEATFFLLSFFPWFKEISKCFNNLSNITDLCFENHRFFVVNFAPWIRIRILPHGFDFEPWSLFTFQIYHWYVNSRAKRFFFCSINFLTTISKQKSFSFYSHF